MQDGCRSASNSSLHYQPKIDMTSGQITGVEASLRWAHPELGLVSPVQFIPLAEETADRADRPLGVEGSLRPVNMAWQRYGLRPVTIAVNLSPQFADGQPLHDVDEALAAHGRRALQLEVTEKHGHAQRSGRSGCLMRFQSRGIRLAIDEVFRDRLFIDVADEAVPDRYHRSTVLCLRSGR